MKQGFFITLEGGEGVGKTTNLSFIKQQLQFAGFDVLTTREPGGTQLAEKIRQLLLEEKDEQVSEQAELLMMFAARAQHIQQVIKPALEQGKCVLCDRFTDATYAYQGGGREMDMKMIAWLEEKVQNGLKPDLTFLLDALIEIGMQRANKRGKLDRFESEQQAFFQRVRKTYLQRAEEYPEVIKIINADQPLQQVQDNIELMIKLLLQAEQL